MDKGSVQGLKWTSGIQSGLWVLLILALLSPLCISILWENAPVDEAYQQLQQARNLAQGVSVRWEGLSPFLTVLLASSARLADMITPDTASVLLPAAAIALSVLGWMLATVTWFLIGLTLNQPIFAGAIVLLLAVHPLQPRLLGLESGLTFGLFGLATLFAVRGKIIASLITSMVLVLTQPPMLGFAIPLVALGMIWKRRSPSLGHIAVLVTFGSILYVLAIAFILAFPGIAGDSVEWGSPRTLAPLAIAAQLLLAIGFAYVVPDTDWLNRPLADRRVPLRGAVALGLMVLVAWQGRALLREWQLQPVVRRSQYGDMAEWLKIHTLPVETIGTTEEGLLGYLANRTTLSLPQTEDASALLAAIDELRPDYCLASDDLVWHNVRQDPWFQRRYQPSFQLANPHDTASPLTVFQYIPTPYDAGPFVDTPARFTADGREWIELSGYRLDGRRIARASSKHLTLYWRAATQVNQELVSIVRLVDPVTGAVLTKTEHVAPGGLGTQFWNAGSAFADHYALSVPADLAPRDYVIDAALYLRQDDATPVMAGPKGDALQRSSVPLASVFLPPDVSVTPPRPDNETSFSFGDEIELVGYDAPSRVRPGEGLTVALYWYARAPVPVNYKVFVHVLGPDGQLLAQDDSLPINWSYPTTYWQPGEFIRDEHLLTIDSSVPRGDYALSVGIYNASSGERAFVRDSAGVEYPEKRVLLQQIEVR
jgi:hypothetical protein